MSFERRAGAAGAWARMLRATLAALVVGLVATAPASAFDVSGFDVTPSTTQAGAHADVLIGIDFELDPVQGFPFPNPFDGVSTVEVAMPGGVMGDAGRFPTCSRADFATSDPVPYPEAAGNCPTETIVGRATVQGSQFGAPQLFEQDIAVIDPGGTRPALLGFRVLDQPTYIEIGVRTGGDYGLTTVTRNIPLSGVAIESIDIELWGNPSAHGTGGPAVPFMTNPTDCTKSGDATLRARNYAEPDTWHEASSPYPLMTGCENLDFDPSISIQARNPVVDSPTGVGVGITIPQNDDPTGLATPALRDVIVGMPEGMTINPALALDRASCADGAFGLNNAGAASCPGASKIGSIGLDVPALRQPLAGDIYLGDPKPGNPFRLFLYAEGQGVRVKLEGAILPDPKTGRITAVFQNNPQVPFRSFGLQFLGGQRSALLTPRTCGTGTISGLFTPYSSNQGVGRSSTMWTVGDAQGNPCPETAPFAPEFTAGVTNASSGEDTGFTVSFRRPAGHQLLSGLKMHLPAGLLGRLTAFPLCPNEQANAGTCGAESMVGSTLVSAGSGSSPLNVPGRVYLTEPPKPGQIAGLSIVVPAVAGPYDLGTPVVRAGITVNRDTSLTVESDPFPTILSGVELRIQQIIVNMDAPGFMFNPTDCSPKTITGTLTSTTGAEAAVGSPFRVQGCATKPLEGRVGMTLTVPGGNGVSGLQFALGGLPGHSNVRQIQAILPSGVGARLDGPLQTPCPAEQFAADGCADSARIGSAKAFTPVLPEPLAGQVFFIENLGGNRLPQIGMKLKGAIDLDIVGEVEITRSGRVVATFAGIPDVPISDFTLDLETGANGVLTNAGVCGKRNVADVDIIGHTGKQVHERIPVTVKGCSAASKAPKSKKGAKAKAKKPKRG